MRIVNTLLVGSLILVCAMGRAQAPAAESKADIEREVLKVEDERNDAIMKGDLATLDKMYSDEIAWTNPHGELLTKTQVLSNLKSGEQKFLSIKHSERHVHVYGDTVVMTVYTRSSVRYKGKTSDSPRRFTNVFVKRDGRWMLVVHAATPVEQ